MTRFLSLAFLAAALPLAASAQPARRAMPDVPARVAALAGRLDLAPDQRTRLDAVAARYAGQTDAAALWAASAELQSVLTAEQTAALAARRTERRAAPRDGARRARTERSARPDRSTRPGAQRDPATAERRAAAQAVRTEFAPRAEALRTSLRAGGLTPAQFAEQSRALRAQQMQRLDATRTPEQRQRAEQMSTRREATEAARIRALSLTADQQRALDGLAAERLAERVRTSPERGAARPDAAQRQQRMETMRAERAAMQTRAAAILTPQQAATEAIHAALAHSARPDRGARSGVRGAGRRGRN